MVITFIGMPGCGKSCMGRAIAGKLRMKLIDSDKLIEKRCGKKLQELIAQNGLNDKVDLGGTFCMGKCQQGVCVTVNDTFHSVTPETVAEFFAQEVLAKI